MSKKPKKRVCYQQEKQSVEASLERLSQAGLIGKSYVRGDGERLWYVGPQHQQIMLEFLRHPERWDEVPAFAKRKEEMYKLRAQAIAQGLISSAVDMSAYDLKLLQSFPDATGVVRQHEPGEFDGLTLPDGVVLEHITHVYVQWLDDGTYGRLPLTTEQANQLREKWS